MNLADQPDPVLADFSGLAPLFPLPNLVLFPHALIPLHIFEPRYRQMTADALAGEQLIAMSLLRPGWERKSGNRPSPLHPIVGLGKILSHEKLEDGRYFLVLRGVARARLLREMPVMLPYRVGELEICVEADTESSDVHRESRLQKILSLFGHLFPGVKLQEELLRSAADAPLATVCDVLLGSMPLAPELLQQFLAELDVQVRSEKLLELLQAVASGQSDSLQRTFPPGFSRN